MRSFLSLFFRGRDDSAASSSFFTRSKVALCGGPKKESPDMELEEENKPDNGLFHVPEKLFSGDLSARVSPRHEEKSFLRQFE